MQLCSIKYIKQSEDNNHRFVREHQQATGHRISTKRAYGNSYQQQSRKTKRNWVSLLDIAAVIAEEIEKPFNGRTIRYIASEELSPNEVAKILGESISKPDLKWLVIPDEQLLKGMMASGMNSNIAKGLVEMNASRRGDVLYEDYNRNKPTLGKIKLKEWAEEFAAVYNKA